MLTTLEWLLDPVGRVEFREQHYGRKALLIRGHPGKFADLFTWDDLNRLLNALSYPHFNVEVAAAGVRSQPATAASLVEQCRAGASLIFTQMQMYEPKLGELARAIEAEIGEPMFVSLVLSQPSQVAFPRHYDRQDVFVLQIDGDKAWSVHDPTVIKPVVDMYEDGDDSASHLSMECELAPGDVLYVPRGHWHEALAQRGTSLHLSLGISARTGIDFLAWLINELRSEVRFRHELPLSFAGEPAELRERHLRDHVAELAEILQSRLADPETIQSFIKHCVLSDRDVRRFKLPAQLFEAPGTQLGIRHFSRPARQRFLLEDGPTAELIALNVWGHIFHFPKTARPLVEFIVSRTAFAYEDALAHAGELTEQGIWEVLDPLLREGILDAADE
ncbi:MAG: JmjC domain-containing protein [Thermoanaerobaculia bacterium]